MSLVSVIIPTFNGDQYLSRCLDSLLAQTCSNFEVIVVDDGSTDGTMLLLEAYRQKFTQTFLLLQIPNSGQGVARNLGVQVATGTYLSFIDSDDVIDPTYLAKLVEAIERENADLAICAYRRIAMDGTELMVEMQQNQINRQSINTSVWNKLFKRSLWQEYRVQFAEGLWYEDLQATLCYLAISEQIAWIKTPLYDYYQRPKSSIQLFDERVEDIFKVSNEIRVFATRQGVRGDRLIELEGHLFSHVILGHLSRCAMESDYKKRGQYIERTKQYINKQFPKYWKHPSVELRNVWQERTGMSVLRCLSVYLLKWNLFGVLLAFYRVRMTISPTIKRW